MLNIINNILPDPIKELLKDVTVTQGGQWIEKKELRIAEANRKIGKHFNPKAARTRSFQNFKGDLLVNRKAVH